MTRALRKSRPYGGASRPGLTTGKRSTVGFTGSPGTLWSLGMFKAGHCALNSGESSNGFKGSAVAGPLPKATCRRRAAGSKTIVCSVIFP